MKYTMTVTQLQRLMDACKPVPLIMLQCGMPPSPQENANAAWQALGEEMGFQWETVKPGATDREFSAEPKGAD